MDGVSHLKRDPAFFKQHLKKEKDKSLTTDVALTIHVPRHYEQRGLCIENENSYHILGIFAYVSGDVFCTNITPATMEITPFDKHYETINDVEYIVFEFPKGSTVLKTVDLVRVKTVVYDIYTVFITAGRVPWFLTYEQHAGLFDQSAKYADAKIGAPVVFETIISMISRDPELYSRMYRQVITSHEFTRVHPPTVVPFNSVIYNVHTTMNKLIGSYFDDSINATLTQRSEHVDTMESILRK